MAGKQATQQAIALLQNEAGLTLEEAKECLTWPIAKCTICVYLSFCESDGYPKVGPFCESFETKEAHEHE